jgi:hypothetical protein
MGKDNRLSYLMRDLCTLLQIFERIAGNLAEKFMPTFIAVNCLLQVYFNLWTCIEASALNKTDSSFVIL